MNHRITIYHHTNHPIWSKIYANKFLANGITNGAYTYSVDIVKYHIPIIVKQLNNQDKYKNIIISTVATIDQSIIPSDTDLVICYLHETLSRDIKKVRQYEFTKTKFIYITSRIEVCRKLVDIRKSCIFLPMAIDVSKLEKYQTKNKYKDKRVIYFGNKYLGKDGSYSQTKSAFVNKGWIFDQISYNKFNDGETLPRNKILEIISKYQYGVGEGRCVLEMNALGIKTLICAGACQGLMINNSDFIKQKRNNFSDGKVWTFSDDILTCIDNFDKAIIKTHDVHDVIPQLEQQLKEILT